MTEQLGLPVTAQAVLGNRCVNDVVDCRSAIDGSHTVPAVLMLSSHASNVTRIAMPSVA
jgi:hypothetical protein